MMEEDPFLELLQGALEVPDDLTLGSSAREQLLAAAAAARGAGDKIIPFTAPSSLERDAFDWLVGERPAGSALLTEIISSPRLQSSLEEDRRFLKSLRESLRRPAAVSRTTARRPLSTVAAIAALLLISAIPAWKALPHPSSTAESLTAAAAPGSVASVSTLTPRSAPQRMEAPHLAASDTVSAPSVVAVRNPPKSTPKEIVSVPPTLVAGAGCSIAATDPGWKASITSMAAMPSGPETAIAWKETSAEAAPESALAVNSLTREKAAGYFPGMASNFNFDNNMLLVSRGEGGDLSIPEPSGAVPVMVGFMILLMHRFRRRLPKAHHPIRP